MEALVGLLLLLISLLITSVVISSPNLGSFTPPNGSSTTYGLPEPLIFSIILLLSQDLLEELLEQLWAHR